MSSAIKQAVLTGHATLIASLNCLRGIPYFNDMTITEESAVRASGRQLLEEASPEGYYSSEDTARNYLLALYRLNGYDCSLAKVYSTIMLETNNDLRDDRAKALGIIVSMVKRQIQNALAFMSEAVDGGPTYKASPNLETSLDELRALIPLVAIPAAE